MVMEKYINGVNLNLRDVEISDSAFILGLRTDSRKSRFLHPTENNLEKQIQYIRQYKKKQNEWYFIIESKTGESLGTMRIYDLREDSFCIGSWLIKDDAPMDAAVESFLLTNLYGFFVLELNHSHFDVRKENKKVLRFHRLFGAVECGETEEDVLLTREKKDFCRCALMVKELIPCCYQKMVCENSRIG